MTGSDLIGRGWSFPLRLNSAGNIQLDGGGDELDAAIRMILTTAPGERVMRPDFGCEAWDHIFDGVNARTCGLVEHSVRAALARWEPRIELEDVTARASRTPGQIEVDVTYRVKATNDTRNLVHPFYAIPGEGGAP